MSDERDELAEFIGQLHSIIPNLNDTFYLATADGQEIAVGDGPALAAFWRKHGPSAFTAIASVIRAEPPLEAVASTPEFGEALSELTSGKDLDESEPGWSLLDEFTK